MIRAFLSVSMALCAIVGILILFNACVRLPSLILNGGGNWDAVIGDLIGVVFAAGLLYAATAIRRRLKAMDARVGDNAGE